jgi:general secretion pathway protein A
MYESFFGLREPPFSLNPDPRFLWLSETHQEGLAALAYGIASRKGFILLTGGIGTGKTTLLRAALARMPETIEVAFLANTEGLTGLELLKLVAAEFHVPGPLGDRADCLIALKSFLEGQAREGTRAVVVIDECQNLGLETLEQVRLLSNLETDTRKLVQIVLTGQPELRRKLQSRELEPLMQRIVIDHHLAPLRPYEVQPYLEHRLRVVGARYERVFEPGAESAFYGFSAGCPRLVSLLADRVLISAYSQGLRPVPKALVEGKAKEIDATRSDELWEADIWEE